MALQVLERAGSTVIMNLIFKGLSLYSRLNTAKKNKRNFQALGIEVKRVTGILETLNAQGVPYRGVLRTGVDALTEALVSAEDLLEKYRTRNKARRFFTANSLKEKFRRVYKQLKSAEQHLNTALNVEQRGHRNVRNMGMVPWQRGARGGTMYPSHTSIGYAEGPGFRAAGISETIYTPNGLLQVSHFAVELGDDDFYYYDDDDYDDY